MSSGWKALWAILGVVVLASIVFSLLAWSGRWFDKAAEVTGPTNVSEQHDYITRDWEGLVTAASNACSAGSVNSTEKSPVFVESPEQAYAATFTSIRAQYNARQDNLFKAKLVGPPGYPSSIPIDLGADGDWCSVPTALQNLKESA